MNEGANPYDLIATDLRGLAEQEGAALWQDRHRLTGLMLDHQPDLRREIRTMASAVEHGVAQALADSDRSLAGIVIDRQAAQLETEVGLRAEVAKNIVRAIAHALNLGPLPSVYAQDRALRSDPRGGDRGYAMPPQPVSSPSHQPAWSHPYPSSAGHPPPYSQPRGQGRKFIWPAAILGGGLAVAAAVLIVPQLGGGPPKGNVSVAEPVRPPSDAALGYGQELADFNVPAQSTLQANVGSETPLQIPAGRRVTTQEVRDLINREQGLILIDVFDGAHGRTLTGAHWIPAIGRPGTFTDDNQVKGKTAIDSLSGGDTSRPLVFYCVGLRCWESYNATLRAAAMGYTNLYWYRGGLQAWEDAGLPMQPLGTALGGL